MRFKKRAGLNRELGLWDVTALSTGAMISAGFFLLPGIASQYTGPSVFLAYFLAAFLILPAMFSIAELATATPKAGGSYFFIDRSLGPIFGTIGGMGNYLALVMKTAFALVGIGAYAAIYFDIPVKLTAVIAGLVFMLLNIFGVKKTSGVQRFFVLMLVVILVFFIGEGLREIFFSGSRAEYLNNYKPFLNEGFEGLIATTALVFVSYLGLTQVASMAEEIEKPERNIPLGMVLSLFITAIIYVLGVFIMVGTIPAEEFLMDISPASTASKHIFSLVSPSTGTLLIVIAAVSAFASTGNAGLLTTSRFPLAMARDRIFPPVFARISRYNIPYVSVLATTAILLVVILFLTESEIAKMASSFMLVVFILLNASVIVMRKSMIEAYDPGFHSPFYPWMQIFGIISSFFLIINLGWGTGFFTMVIAAFSVAWYWYYARKYTRREGAIYHWFALLGKREHKELENEFLHILKEKGLRDGDPFNEMIVQAGITIPGSKRISFETLLSNITKAFARDIGNVRPDDLKKEFLSVTRIDPALIIPRVSILHGKVQNIEKPLLHIVISRRGVRKPVVKGEVSSEDRIKVFFFMLSRSDEPKLQLRLLSRLMDIVERDCFVEDISAIENHREIKEYLLHSDRYITLELKRGTVQEELIDRSLKEISMPADVLVALLQRKSNIFTPRGDTVLLENDIITVIGEPKGIKALFDRYIHKSG